MRSWFRVGLRMGLLAGVGFAVVMTLRARRGSNGASDGSRAGNGPRSAVAPVGVHGDWPDVRRAADRASDGDHHPHGRVTVPLEAAPMGAPPAVSTAQPGRDEPEVPAPAEHLDSETEMRPVAKAAGPVKKAVKKAAKKAAGPVKKAVKKAIPPDPAAPMKKAAAKAAKKAAGPIKKAAPRKASSKPDAAPPEPPPVP